MFSNCFFVVFLIWIVVIAVAAFVLKNLYKFSIVIVKQFIRATHNYCGFLFHKDVADGGLQD